MRRPSKLVTSRVAERAAALRRDFDRSFAAPVHVVTAGREELLAIRLGAQRHAVRLSEIAGLHADKKITHVPGGDAALLGIVGFRGALLPVYDLAVLLGHPGAEAPRWLIVAAAAPVALAFAAFEGQLRVAREEIVPQAARTGHAREVVRTRDFVGSIMHLPSVLDAIKALKTEAAPSRE